eukprot:7506412-Pyramimonas_sp.AAC.1
MIPYMIARMPAYDLKRSASLDRLKPCLHHTSHSFACGIFSNAVLRSSMTVAVCLLSAKPASAKWDNVQAACSDLLPA